MKFPLSIILFSLLTSGSLLSQVDSIRLNEVVFEQSNGFSFLEFRNFSDQEVDLSSLYILVDDESDPISSFAKSCGAPSDNTIDPFGYFGIFIELGFENGEIVLSKSIDLSDSSDLLDYVLWGNANSPEYDSIAIAAGEWDSDSTLEPIFITGVLEYDGDGNSPTDWNSVPIESLCRGNGSGCNISTQTVEYDTNPIICICDDESDDFRGLDLYTSAGGVQFTIPIYFDEDNIIISVGQDIDEFEEDICTEGRIFFAIVAHTGEIVGLEKGQNLDDLQGCFVVTDSVELTVYEIKPFETELSINGENLSTEQFEVCMNSLDIISMSTNSTNQTAYYVVDTDNKIVVESAIAGDLIQYNNLEAGEYRIVVFAYEGERTNSLGNNVDYPAIQGCSLKDENEYTFTILDASDPNCTSSLSQIDFNEISLKSNIVTTQLELNIKMLTSYDYNLYSSMGILKVGKLDNTSGKLINCENLIPGSYYLRLKKDSNIKTFKFIKI